MPEESDGIHEGRVRKGGVNTEPSTPRPENAVKPRRPSPSKRRETD